MRAVKDRLIGGRHVETIKRKAAGDIFAGDDKTEVVLHIELSATPNSYAFPGGGKIEHLMHIQSLRDI